MKLERTVLWAEKDLFLEDGDPAIGFLGFLRGCFCESGLQTDENLPETLRAEYAETSAGAVKRFTAVGWIISAQIGTTNFSKRYSAS